MIPEIRLLSMYQPWVGLMPKFKEYETRPKYYSYRGWVALQAAKRLISQDDMDAIARGVCGGSEESTGWLKNKLWSIAKTPNHGKILHVAYLEQCLFMVENSGDLPPKPGIDTILISAMTELERATGNWQPGRWALMFSKFQTLSTPVECRGYQGLTRIVDQSVLGAIANQVNLEA